MNVSGRLAIFAQPLGLPQPTKTFNFGASRSRPALSESAGQDLSENIWFVQVLKLSLKVDVFFPLWVSASR